MTIQRMIEMQGIPTVLVTAAPAESAQARPPRALAPKGHSPGRTFGRPGDAELHLRILTDALDLLLRPAEPGTVTERDYH